MNIVTIVASSQFAQLLVNSVSFHIDWPHVTSILVNV